MTILTSIDAATGIRNALKVRITLSRAFVLRLKVAVFLMRLVSRICPLEVEIIETGK